MTAYVPSTGVATGGAGTSNGLTMPFPGNTMWTGPWSTGTAQQAFTDQQMMAIPFAVSRPLSVSQIGIEIVTPGSGGAKNRLGIYLDRGDNAGPGPLLIDCGQVDESLVAAPHGVPCAIVIAANQQVWLASVPQGGGIHATLRANTSITMMGGICPASGPFTGPLCGLFYTPVAGALPNPWPSIVWTNFATTFPLIKLMAA